MPMSPTETQFDISTAWRENILCSCTLGLSNKSREKEIHLASHLQDGDGKSSSLESSACMRHSEPSLSVSFLPKKISCAMEGGRRTGKKKEGEVMNVNISNGNEITKGQSCDQSS